MLGEIDALVDAGRRAPGSDAERRSALHLERRLAELGRPVERQSIVVWPNWPPALALFAALSVVASVASVSMPKLGAALALAGALLTLVEGGLLLPTVRRLLGRRASQNVISWGDGARPGLLLLVAHYDAGRGHIRLRPMFWAQLAVLACCLARLPGVEGLILTAVQFVPTAALVVAIALLVEVALAATPSSENDNASGVALALQLIERLGEERLEHFEIGVLFSGGQTALSAGMRGFLKRHRRQLARDRTIILNLDQVGSGELRYTRREGALFTLRSHAQLVAVCEAIAEDEEEAGAGVVVNREASDGFAARAAGLPALTITCRDARGRAPARVEEVVLERAEGFCLELIRRLDAEIGAELSPSA
jgi:peptidase M28-like protein